MLKESTNLSSVQAAPSSSLPEDFYIQALLSGPAAVAIIDAVNLSIVFTNNKFNQEFSHEALIDGKTTSFLQLLDEAHHSRFNNALLHVAQHPEDASKYVVFDIRNSEGERIGYYAYISPMAMPGTGQKYFKIMLLPEISKWDLPFISFDTRELFLEQLDGLGFGTFEWDIEHDQMFWSDGLYKIFGLGSDEPVTKEKMGEMIFPEDRAATKAATEAGMQAGGVYTHEFRIYTATQKICNIKAVGRLIKDAEGKPVKLIGSMRDITAQRSIEADLQKNLSDLNRSNQELEEFAYVASHDLQEPLRKISTFCGRIAEKYSDKLDADGKLYIDRTLASAENMRLLIHNLLEFSRVARNTEPFSELSIGFIVNQVKTDLELVIEETGATISTGTLPHIQGSVTQMKQLFYNLINNAIKFRKEDARPVIDISAAKLDEDEKLKFGLKSRMAYHKIIIKDNGIGFDQKYATRIFQIFQRLHGKTEYPGSGIGLAICKKIVEHHKGIISAEGTEQGGASFTIILPEHQ